MAGERWRLATVSLAVGLALAAAWIIWAVIARVAVYETTPKARLEVQGEAHPVVPDVGGRVVTSNLLLGAEVTAGMLLVSLDTRAEELELAEAKANLAAIGPVRTAITGELALVEQSLGGNAQTSHAALEEAKARQRELEASLALAVAEAEQLEKLAANQTVPALEASRARSQRDRLRASVQAATQDVRRLGGEAKTSSLGRRGDIERLRRELAILDGRGAQQAAVIARLEHEIERRRIRAPVAGRIAEHRPLQVGAYIAASEPIASIVPAGELTLIAQFPPETAIGRFRAGQPARMRLDAFPWIQYGSLTAQVLRVAAEPRDRTVRVELAIERDPSFTVPLQHGMTGAVEIVVERVSPLTLIMRSAGGLVDDR
ncbi:MAG: HlyD family secretion protein [Kofleriaceae bacterium]